MYEIFEQLLHIHEVTPYKVSKITGIQQSTLSDWKNGKSIPKVEKLILIADYFGVTLDYLLGNEQKEKPAFKSEHDLLVEELMAKFKTYDIDQLKALNASFRPKDIK